MSSQKQQYVGRFTLPAAASGFNVRTVGYANDWNCVMNTGDYFLFGHDGETTEQLIEAMQNTMRDVVGATQNTANISYSATTGKITIDLKTNGNVHMNADLADLLGFNDTILTSGSGSANTWTGDRQPRYLWRPTRGLSDHPVHINTWWDTESTSKVTRSIDGSVHTVQGNQLYSGAFTYRALPQADVTIDPGATDDNFRPLEQFWGDVIHTGSRIRAYQDRDSNDDSGDYKEGYWVLETSLGETMDIGAFSETVGRSVARWDNLWDVEFSMMKHV